MYIYTRGGHRGGPAGGVGAVVRRGVEPARAEVVEGAHAALVYGERVEGLRDLGFRVQGQG